MAMDIIPLCNDQDRHRLVTVRGNLKTHSIDALSVRDGKRAALVTVKLPKGLGLIPESIRNFPKKVIDDGMMPETYLQDL